MQSSCQTGGMLILVIGQHRSGCLEEPLSRKVGSCAELSAPAPDHLWRASRSSSAPNKSLIATLRPGVKGEQSSSHLAGFI